MANVKLNFYHLHSDELKYELRIRGHENIRTVAEMRKKFSALIKTSRLSVTIDSLELDAESEIETCEDKLSDISLLIAKEPLTSSQKERLLTSLLHVQLRICRLASSDDTILDKISLLKKECENLFKNLDVNMTGDVAVCYADDASEANEQLPTISAKNERTIPAPAGAAAATTPFPTDAKFLWPTSYTLKATLTVPEAGVVEPYQVWYDGETKKSRVDFYDGMDKLYRQFDAVNKKYQYFKIHPETTKKLINKYVCEVMAPDATVTVMYAQSNYLPIKDFQFQYSEIINGTKVEKWLKSYKVDQKYNATINYNVWVRFVDEKTTAIPVKYEYELKTDEVVVDYFRHDYTYFDEAKPDNAKLELPLEPQCIGNRKVSEDESLDPLTEFVEPNIHEMRINNAFDWFKLKHNKSYIGEEHFMRRKIFKNNYRYINSVNREYRSFSLAVNHLADLTEGELSVFMGTMIGEGEMASDDATNDVDDEEEEGDHVGFDWRDYGAITSVKEQTGFCGACYAFAAAAVVESSAYIVRGCKHLEELSEQAILDCSSNSGNSGCDGGDYTHAFTWGKDHGVPTRKEYGPYLAMEGLCHIEDMKMLVPVPACKKLPKKNRVIKKALREHGPLAAAIDGKLHSFLFYSKGIYNDQRCRSEPHQRSHGVTLIGFGKEGDEKYWILKNSFGTSWGEDGYIRIAVEDNLCGVKNYLYSLNYNKSKAEKCFVRK